MIQIEFPEPGKAARYTVTETWEKTYNEKTGYFVDMHRTLGSVYQRIKGGYEQEVTQNGRIHTIGRSTSLMGAITSLRRFHELTGYTYAPWEESQ